ncbi:MAG: porin [Sphingobacteriales bacterium]|nr:MAG: porin [Sphingobacteriales bacterium]
MMDTTTSIGKGLYPLYGKHDRLRFGGYMQPQFQFAQDKGVKNYSGGDFAPNSSNRFMLRRGRIRIDYAHFNDQNQPLALFAFQFDGTERGVAIRDFWGRFYENRLQVFALTAGMFARPMGFEANFSSSDREAPERGRMSQILMRTERDLGAMLTFETRGKNHPLRKIKVDLGVFNGQGLAGPGEYDSHKDLIGRLSLKPQKLGKREWQLSASASGYLGGIASQSPWYYQVKDIGAGYQVVGDSTPNNINRIAARKYYGADAQLKIPNRKGYTEFRAEMIRGLQTGTASSSETPGSYPATSAGILQPLYTRSFNGAYLYYLQHLGLDKLQLILKYDWYDPNDKVKGKEVSATRGFTAADVRYDTYGGGLMYYINAHVKMTAFYDYIVNESTDIKGYTKDIQDNIFTLRLQYRF